jgi:hypothetical protein
MFLTRIKVVQAGLIERAIICLKFGEIDNKCGLLIAPLLSLKSINID